MTICKKCAKAADKGKKHPKKPCGCPCQHKPSGSWNLRPGK